jgi:Spx/MgsR family transcriptional regulator
MMLAMTHPTSSLQVFGIPNCDTVKKARAWLSDQGSAYDFIDFKKQGLPEAQLQAWIEQLGWQALLNTRGTTWRRLSDAERTGVTDAASASALMRAQPSVVRRPVVQWLGGEVSVGFDPAAWQARFDAGSAPTGLA